MSTRTSQPQASAGTSPGRSLRRLLTARRSVAGAIGILAVAALFGTAYAIAEPPHASPAPTAAPAGRFSYLNGQPASAPGLTTQDSSGKVINSFSGPATGSTDQGGSGSVTPVSAAPDGVQIVKTGSMALEVGSIDNATAQAQAAIEGLGGYVYSSNRYGTGDDASATITFRLPVARWDDALKAMRALGQKIVSEQTGTADVTSQVVDLDARITNLRATESALLGIMAKATDIKDILAVQEQLTATRSQIEQLTAQENYLKDQAAMSTLSVAFTLPAKTVTTQATNDWDFGKQVDQAVAALVRIGQGLATMAVWAVIVGLPMLVGLLILWLVFRIFRRIRRRSQVAA
jgi:hypothetical protein